MVTTRRACAIASFRGSGDLACSLHVQPQSATPSMNGMRLRMLLPDKPTFSRPPGLRRSFRRRNFRTPGFSGPQIAVLFAAFTLLISIPIWTHPLPPLADYINHLARMHAIATADTNVQLARFYEAGLAVDPEPDHGSAGAAAGACHEHLSRRPGVSSSRCSRSLFPARWC